LQAIFLDVYDFWMMRIASAFACSRLFEENPVLCKLPLKKKEKILNEFLL